MSNSRDLDLALWIHTANALLHGVDHDTSTTVSVLPAEFSFNTGPDWN